MISTLLADMEQLAIAASNAALRLTPLDVVLKTDSFWVLALSRLPKSQLGKRVPLMRWAVRRFLTSAYGVELGRDVELGAGVYFVHTLGVVIGGNTKIGARVRFYGNNTVGTAKDDGYPIIEDDVQVGCGARVLGPVRIGARSVIGANAVVLSDVPPDSVVVGIPAHVVKTRVQQHVHAARMPA